MKQNKKLPLVTVVTITYNLIENKREDYIKQCIESIHNQDYPFIEHIIIDGASNDGTLELLHQYEDLNYVKVYSEPDNGIYDAMNKGIALARGKYLNFMNSDDSFYDKEGIRRSVEYLEEKEADYSFADAMILFENGNQELWKGDISKLLLGGQYCHQSMFVKTELLRSMHGFNTSYEIAADTDLMIRLYACNRKYVKIPACIVTYRMGGLSSQHQMWSRIEHSTAFYRHIGQHISLSQRDCFLLCWNPALFDELPKEALLKLICKVPREYGLEHLLRTFVDKFNCSESKMSKRYYLLGFIPFLKSEYRNDKRYFRLFNILLLLKLVRRNNKKKFFLFGFLPLFKTKWDIK